MFSWIRVISLTGFGEASVIRHLTQVKASAASRRILMLYSLLLAILSVWGATTTVRASTLFKGCNDGHITVGLDIGHSQFDPSATSATGITEFTLNKRFAHELSVMAAHRARDVNAPRLFIHNPLGPQISLRERPTRIQERGGEALISLHHDSVKERHLDSYTINGRRHHYTPKIRGFSIFVSRSNPHFSESFKLARLIGRSLLSAGRRPTDHHAEDIPGERRELLDTEFGVYEAPFAVLIAARIPAVLIELGVIVNRTEERELSSTEVRARTQTAILEALTSYCAGKPVQ